MYYRAWNTILTSIKERFLEHTGLSEEAFCKENDLGCAQETFYLRKVEDNLIQAMDPIHLQEFSQGKSMAMNLCYLASSYAMTFNFLGNRQVTFRRSGSGMTAGTYGIAYKQCFRALKSKNAFVTADACLFSEDGQSGICLEMKMVEWVVFKINPIKDNFLVSDNYFYPDTAKIFIDTLELMVPYLNRDEWEHWCCFQNCDGFLLLRQILGLYNRIRMAKEQQVVGTLLLGESDQTLEKYRNLKELTMTTVYWYAQNADRYGIYRERILRAEENLREEVSFLWEVLEPVRKLFRDTLGVRLQIQNMDYRKFLDSMEKTQEERCLLGRYDV